MRLSGRTEIGDLLRRDTQVHDILGWYSIHVGQLDHETTLAEVCRHYRLDLEDLITDLEAVLDDDDDDDEEDEDSYGAWDD